MKHIAILFATSIAITSALADDTPAVTCVLYSIQKVPAGLWSQATDAISTMSEASGVPVFAANAAGSTSVGIAVALVPRLLGTVADFFLDAPTVNEGWCGSNEYDGYRGLVRDDATVGDRMRISKIGGHMVFIKE